MNPKIIFKILFCFCFILVSCNTTKTKEDSKNVKEKIMPSSTFKAEKTLDTHLAKTQFYRWYQLYERDMNEKRIANQMDILADSIYLKSAAGEMKGKTSYPERLSVYKGWKNAHHIQNISVSAVDETTLSLEADINYQNILPNGDRKSYAIHYSTELEKLDDLLPKFTKIIIHPTGETNDTFKDAYPYNRARSLMHYWIANMEQCDGNVEPFKEILAPNFHLNFSTSNQINSIDAMGQWLRGAPMQVQESNHHPKNFKVTPINDSQFTLEVDFDWYGIAKDGKKMTAKTHHKWLVVDDINERFSRVKQIDVTQMEPFTILEE